MSHRFIAHVLSSVALLIGSNSAQFGSEIIFTILKGSDNLRALFLARNPRATRGPDHPCCGWPSAETPEIGHFLHQSRLYSPFGLRVGAVLSLAKSTTYARWFIVNQGDRSPVQLDGVRHLY